MPKNQWIKLQTAAKLRGVSRQTIRFHIDQGNLRFIDMDGTLYVDQDEVLSWKRKGKGEYKTGAARKRRTIKSKNSGPDPSDPDPLPNRVQPSA